MKGPAAAGALCAREVEGIRREDKPEARRSFRKERWFIVQSSVLYQTEKSFSFTFKFTFTKPGSLQDKS